MFLVTIVTVWSTGTSWCSCKAADNKWEVTSRERT